MRYTYAINDDGWNSQLSVFECRMEHEVPLFGRAVFRTRAGEASGFFLKGNAARFKAGKAALISQNPVWDDRAYSNVLAEIPVKQGRSPVWLNSKITELMLSELSQGRELVMVNDSWYGAQEPVELVISGIGFREQYSRYLACVSGLLPANFDQVRRTSLYMAPGMAEELPSDQLYKLERIMKLLKHDKTPMRLYIDGHADSNGDRADNLEISKNRADLVKEYLTLRGVPEDWIVHRWHGERYPVASNATAAGRAKNRRVTIRLERVEKIDVLPLAQNDVKDSE